MKDRFRDACDQLCQAIGALVQSFSEGQIEHKESLKKLLQSGRRAFGIAGVRALAANALSPGTKYLAYLLSSERLLTPSLLDTMYCTPEDALAAGRMSVQGGERLQQSLELSIKEALQAVPSFDVTVRILRILDLLSATARPDCWASCESELMAYPDKKVRSRAALLVGRGGWNPTWLTHRFRDKDARVQANAVEALWDLPPDQARSMLITMAKSQNNRVAANALVGLYLHGDLTVVSTLMKMALHANPSFALSAVWAIGRTADPRFIPFLLQRYKASQGQMRMTITRALARIRRREKATAEAGPLELRTSEISQQGGRRHVLFTVRPRPDGRITAFKTAEVAVFDSGALVEAYDFKAWTEPDLALIGFVMPRFMESTDRQAHTWAAGQQLCLALKRPADLWRIDRYSITEHNEQATSLVEESNMPYDDSVINTELTMRRGFLSDPERIQKALASVVPRQRSSPDAVQALLRQGDAMAKLTGTRHVILLLHETSFKALRDAGENGNLRAQVKAAAINLHCIVAPSEQPADTWREVSNSIGASTFRDTTVEGLPEAVETLYMSMLNRYLVIYPASKNGGTGMIKVTSAQGSGSIEFPQEIAPPTVPAADPVAADLAAPGDLVAPDDLPAAGIGPEIEVLT
jgi:hypothetical protein